MDTYKLKFGHRGPNQPVLDKATGRVAITSQNHGFAVDAPLGEPIWASENPCRLARRSRASSRSPTGP